jgi:hypothetical protein
MAQAAGPGQQARTSPPGLRRDHLKVPAVKSGDLVQVEPLG